MELYLRVPGLGALARRRGRFVCKWRASLHRPLSMSRGLSRFFATPRYALTIRCARTVAQRAAVSTDRYAMRAAEARDLTVPVRCQVVCQVAGSPVAAARAADCYPHGAPIAR